ncbi:hypothetical protein M3Y97_00364600 [Aphelenchoides bicaudatus]|nr:hypothetical protein M3Y97_00364600 [Aphelenchoides bicaudatus]
MGTKHNRNRQSSPMVRTRSGVARVFDTKPMSVAVWKFVRRFYRHLGTHTRTQRKRRNKVAKQIDSQIADKQTEHVEPDVELGQTTVLCQLESLELMSLCEQDTDQHSEQVILEKVAPNLSSCVTALNESNRDHSTSSLPSSNILQSDTKKRPKFKTSASLSQIPKETTNEMSYAKMVRKVPIFEEIQAYEPNLEARPKKSVLKGALLTRRDTIAKRTDLPKPVDDIPNQTPEDRRKLMHRASIKLERKLSERPSVKELQERNILKTEESELSKQCIEETRKMLLRKLSFRPTLAELKDRQIIKFNDYVEVTEAEIYDRKGDKPWTRLTPSEKALIRKELNDFKANEMDVHDESKIFTRFHKP